MTILDERPPVGAYAGSSDDLPLVLACERDAYGDPLHGAPGSVWSLPGDYLLDCGVWLRVAHVTPHPAEPGRALVELPSGPRLSVDGDRAVMVWRALDVRAWALLTGTAGGAA